MEGILGCLESQREEDREARESHASSNLRHQEGQEQGWRQMRSREGGSGWDASACLHPSLLAAGVLSPPSLTSFTTGQAVTRPLKSLAGLQASAPMPPLLMTQQTPEALARPRGLVSCFLAAVSTRDRFQVSRSENTQLWEAGGLNTRPGFL